VAELMREVGFPPGVVNILPGYGNVAGQYLAEHPQVQKIAFTGSTATGRRIVQASSGNLKRVQLELGGKGANIVFDDADLEAALNGSAFAIFHNQGQACIAGSRLLLHESIADKFLDRFLKLAASIKLGNPLDPQTEMGPLTSLAHRDRVLSYCKVAREEGGEILLGGKVPADAELAKGCYVMPTVVRARPKDRVCQEEVFGPFVTVTTFKHEDEVVAIANDTVYGLASRSPANHHRDGLDKLLQARQSGIAVRRSAQFRLRPRPRDRVDGRIHQSEVGVGQRGREAAAVLSTLTRRRWR
jgi:aldehyde dehydrogenase (NAD+)/betaine-aldehyde dehydrogenase